jgi:peptidoglycan hydrolase-like protein with peptidoglycan-binding domain
MKLLLTICLFLISIRVFASAEQNKKMHASHEAHAGAAAGETSTASAFTRAQTREAERRLNDMGYWTGTVDGVIDPATRSALIAFQKWEGRPVTGKLTLDELEALRTGPAPQAREPGYAHVEIDVDRQVLLIVNDEGDVRVLPVSTGSGEPFIDEGQTSVAYTPRGRFVVYDKVAGWEKGTLGSMYYSNYTSGGVAIHGSRNVPTRTASHGCIRIPVFAAREVSRLLKLGTIVLVYDRVTFVSGRSWAENPKLREAALVNSAANAYEYDYTESTKTPSRSLGIKKARSQPVRAGVIR